MRKPVVLLAASLALLLPTACFPLAASGPTAAPSRPAGEEIVRFSGRVTYVPIEGGFFALISDDDQRYDPGQLPMEFRQEGLRVKVSARRLPQVVGFHMWGPRIEILTIEKE